MADALSKLVERTAGAASWINQMPGKIGNVAGSALSGMGKVVNITRHGVGDIEAAQLMCFVCRSGRCSQVNVKFVGYRPAGTRLIGRLHSSRITIG